MSDFSGLSIGLSGLEANHQALDLVGQDVANANTAGYVQERLSLAAAGGIAHPGFDDGLTGGGTGGVSILGTERLGDEFLFNQSLAEHAASGSLTSQQAAVAQIQQAFPEPSGNGISALLTTYFNSWDQLAQNPGDAATRTSVISAGQSLAAALNTAAASITSVTSTSQTTLASQVSQVGTMADQVASLNLSIRQAGAAGEPTGPLQDQRDALVSTLSDTVGLRTSANADGTVNLYVGTESLVSGVESQHLSVSGEGAATTLRWPDGSTLPDAGGSIGGLQTILTSTAPALASSLDAVASSLAAAVNHAQATGVTTTGQPGAPFFSGTTAATISVAMTDPSGLAAASSSSPTPASGPNLDGSNAGAIAEMATAQTVPTGSGTTTGPVTSYNQFVVGMGGTVASVDERVTTQAAATTAADTAYSNATGVDTDAEMARMVQYQNAYSANAKFISTINSTLDSLLSMVS